MKWLERWWGRLSGAPDVVFALHLIQDLDLALPVMQALRDRGLRVVPWCSTALLEKSPRVLAALQAGGWTWRALSVEQARKVRFPWGVAAVLTAVETNLGPHRFSRALSDRATEAGLFVATMQHGFENVGLTYEDSVHPLDQISFAATRIYTWGPSNTLHEKIAPGVRARCLAVGCPKVVQPPAAGLDGLMPAGQRVVGVFENLHWHRYDDAYREAFMQMIHQLACDFPSTNFLVKPHHAGMWLSRQAAGMPALPGNVLLADPAVPPWESHTAASLLGRFDAVITTPSTVALDAARQALPVAVFASGLHLANYEPLTLINAPHEAHAFVSRSLSDTGREALLARSRQFVEGKLIPGDAAGRIAEDVRARVQ